MKKFRKYAIITGLFLVLLLALSLLGTSAASHSGAQTLTPGNLASALAEYKQSNPSALAHSINAGHRVVYAADAHFNDIVNGSGESYSYYAKRGADAVITALSRCSINAQQMSDANQSTGFEIQIGLLNRAEQQGYLSLIDANEYAIVVTQNRIMLLAWQEATLQACVEAFLAYLDTGATALPIGFVGIGVANSAWKTDFPRPAGSGIALSAAQDVNDDSLQFLYTGTGVTRDAYVAYCTQLVGDGFVLVWENVIGNNEFRMYQSTAKGIALYAAYNDYTYKAEYDELYQVNYGSYDDGFSPVFEPCIRIVSSPLSTVSLPAQINTQQTYTKVTETYMTTVGIAASQVGTCYVILLEDGRFVIIDGGAVSSKNNGVYPESQAIWDTMLTLYKRAYPASPTPTAQRPLHVAAWYLTHGHSDHYNAFYYMAEMIGADSAKKSVFQIDYVIANLPGSYSLYENTSTKWGYDNNAKLLSMRSRIGNFQYLKVHTGQRIYFANLMIEVLMTYEDHLPMRIINTNDTCTVTRFHFKSSGVANNTTVTALSGNATTVMILADSWRPTSRFLCAMYGDYLKSDISQIAHHGNIGCEQELYAAIAPTGVLFSNTNSAYKDYVWGNPSSSNPEKVNAYAVDRYVVLGKEMNGHKLTSVRYVWAAVPGTRITLTFSAAGVDYTAAFDLMQGNTVTYVDLYDPLSQQTGFSYHVHRAGQMWYRDDVEHRMECACGYVLESGAHADTDRNCKCDVCQQIVDGSHQFGAWEKYMVAKHKRSCSCGTVEYGEHVWDNGVISVPPLHMEEGVCLFTCIDCTQTREESVPKLDEHLDGEWETYTTVRHKRTCACGVTEYASHEWDDGVITTDPTHLAFGTKTYSCSCGQTRQTRVSKDNTHEYGACEAYSDMQHKRVCECGMEQYALHTWSEAVVSVEPTQTQAGSRTRCCTECGAEFVQSIPPLSASDNQAAVPDDTVPDTVTDGVTEENGAGIGSVIVIVAIAVLLAGGGVCVGLFLRKDPLP